MLDLQTLAALNKFWQEKFDRKHPTVARRRSRSARKPGIGDICPRCHRRIATGTHSYSDLGGFECLNNRAGGPKTAPPLRSRRSRKSTL